MSDTGGFPLVGGNAQFPGKNNVTRDSSGSNSFGWENLNNGRLSHALGTRNKVTGITSFALGVGNTVSGEDGCFAAGYNCTSSGAYGTFAIGSSCTASAAYSFAGGVQSQCTGAYSFAFGSQNISSGNNSTTFGQVSLAAAIYSFAIGTYSYATRQAEFAHANKGVGSNGACQHGWLVFGNQSISATPINLYLDGTTATQNAVLGTGARWKCTAEIIATTTGAINKSASWEYKFQIDRPTTAASAIIRTTPLLALSDGSNSGAPPAGWAVAITADTTNGCPQIQVTGDTDTINWTCCIHYIQSIRV